MHMTKAYLLAFDQRGARIMRALLATVKLLGSWSKFIWLGALLKLVDALVLEVSRVDGCRAPTVIFRSPSVSGLKILMSPAPHEIQGRPLCTINTTSSWINIIILIHHQLVVIIILKSYTYMYLCMRIDPSGVRAHQPIELSIWAWALRCSTIVSRENN